MMLSFFRAEMSVCRVFFRLRSLRCKVRTPMGLQIGVPQRLEARRPALPAICRDKRLYHPPVDQVSLRIMGLDVGDRRIGVAVSDPLGLTAQPVLTLVRTNRKQDLKSLQRILRKYGCVEIVVGNPLYMSGDLSPQAAKAQAFAQTLRDETMLPVHLWDERLTTTEAHRHLHAAGRPGSEHRSVVDQVAAVLILESFLEARRSASRSDEPVS
jgi:putative holliday junction resolvase